MEINKNFIEGLTFDDVLLVPAYSEVLPREVNTITKFSKNININVPLASAAMDTVTESDLAIAISRQGGIGILHKNMSIEHQSAEVRKVKRSENGMIFDPITLTEKSTLAEAHVLMRQNKIGGIPIVNEAFRLVGILTNRDLRFEENLKCEVKDIMTKENLITAREGEIDLDKAEKILQKYKIEKLPVIDTNSKLVGLITYKDISKLKNYPQACKDKFGRLLVGAAVGVTGDTFTRIEALVKAGVDVVTIDTAHGHSKGVFDVLKKAKSLFPQIDIVAGNVATADGAKFLADAGADGVKVGIGPGSICTTRIIAGVGVPQLMAIQEAARGLQGYNVPVIADGGVRYTGDIAKAIAAGASCVMAGGLFAGCEESPGETIIFEGRKFKNYRGMGSIEAMQTGSKDRYFQDAEDDVKKLVPEGIVGRVPYKGTLAEVMAQYIGGLRASMGYCGAKNIETLQKAQFVRITNSGINESHPHDVIVTKEAPNYSRK